LQEQANQGARAGVSSVIKGASLGYANPWPLKNPTPDQQNASNALSFMGSILPYELLGKGMEKINPGKITPPSTVPNPGFMTKLLNSAAPAALVGGAESLPGNQGDIGQRLKNVGTGALVGGGLHLGGEFLGSLAKFLPFMPKEAPIPPEPRQFGNITKPGFQQFSGRSVRNGLASSPTLKAPLTFDKADAISISNIKKTTARMIKEAANHNGIDEVATANTRRAHLKRIFNELQEVHDQTDRPRVKAAIRQAQTKLAYEHRNYDYKALLREERASQARQRKLEAEAVRLQKLADKPASILKKEEEKQAEKLQILRDKQTVKDNLALEKAESQNRQREMRQLRADIQGRSKQNAVEEKSTRKEADEAAKERMQEANTRVRQRQEYIKGHIKELRAEEKASQDRQKQIQAEIDRVQVLQNKQTATLENLRYKQAAKDRMALEKAESKNRQRELKILKAEIKDSYRNKDLQAKQEAQSDKALNDAEEENRQRELKILKAEIKDSYRNKDLQAKQEAQSDKALNDGEEENRQRRTARLRGDIRERYAEQEAEDKENSPEKEHTLKRSDLMPVTKMRAIVHQANAAGESVTIRYYAERTGETGQWEQKTLHDVRIIEGVDGKETKWKGINEDGQLHTYIERDANGNLKDSNIVSVEPTGEKVKFQRTIHPDRGDVAVLDKSTGEIIPQTYRPGIKSSEIRANIKKMKAVINSDRPTITSILEASEGLDSEELEDAMEGMTQDEVNDLCHRMEP